MVDQYFLPTFVLFSTLITVIIQAILLPGASDGYTTNITQSHATTNNPLHHPGWYFSVVSCVALASDLVVSMVHKRMKIRLRLRRLDSHAQVQEPAHVTKRFTRAHLALRIIYFICACAELVFLCIHLRHLYKTSHDFDPNNDACLPTELDVVLTHLVTLLLDMTLLVYHFMHM